jgi:hypothetical protein
MPTIVHLVGAEKPVTLQEDYDTVTKALQGREVGLFGENTSRVAIYKSGVTYIEEASEGEILSPEGFRDIGWTGPVRPA